MGAHGIAAIGSWVRRPGDRLHPECGRSHDGAEQWTTARNGSSLTTKRTTTWAGCWPAAVPRPDRQLGDLVRSAAAGRSAVSWTPGRRERSHLGFKLLLLQRPDNAHTLTAGYTGSATGPAPVHRLCQGRPAMVRRPCQVSRNGLISSKGDVTGSYSPE